jgi:hypothetical protein
MKLIKTSFIASLGLLATVTAQAQLQGATLCAGATTHASGSIILLGQPFVGQMTTPGGGVSMQIGVLPSVTVTVPSPPLSLNALGFQLASGGFGFNFLGQSGQTYVVEASTNLLYWSPIWTNLGTGGILSFNDLQAAQHPQRFYRVLIP